MAKFNKKRIVKSKPKPKTNEFMNASVDALLKMDVYKLKTPSLKQVVNRLVKIANKRLVKLSKDAPNSPSFIKHSDNNRIIKFDANVNGRNNIEMVMKSVKGFLTSKTSTIEGFLEHRKQVEKRLGQFESEKQETDFWHIYNDWVSKHPSYTERFNNSFQLQQMFYHEYVERGKTSRGVKGNITKAIKMMLGERTISNELEDMFERKGLAERKDVFKFKSNF